jgi:AraC-like DNA-binding protein
VLLDRYTFGRLCRARDVLAACDSEPLRIKLIASEIEMSPFHFIRQFKALFGQTPHQFRIQSRLDRAKILLAHGHSVTDVCMEVGFSSLGTFSHLFARRFHMPPSLYQRRARVFVRPPGPAFKAFPDLFPGCLSLMALLPPNAFSNFQEAAEGLPSQN